MVFTSCFCCHSPVVFSNGQRGAATPCPNCGQSIVPEESLPEDEVVGVIEGLHRWARETNHRLGDTKATRLAADLLRGNHA